MGGATILFTVWKLLCFLTANKRGEHGLSMWVWDMKEHCVWVYNRIVWALKMWKIGWGVGRNLGWSLICSTVQKGIKNLRLSQWRLLEVFLSLSKFIFLNLTFPDCPMYIWLWHTFTYWKNKLIIFWHFSTISPIFVWPFSPPLHLLIDGLCFVLCFLQLFCRKINYKQTNPCWKTLMIL